MGQRLIAASAAVLLLALSTTALATIPEVSKATQAALDSGKTCTAIWSAESSKKGEATKVFGVRDLNGKTQYLVYHSASVGNIWTWDFRIQDIKCK